MMQSINYKKAHSMASRGSLTRQNMKLFEILFSWCAKGYRTPTVQELAEELDWTKGAVRYHYDRLRHYGIITEKH